MINKNLTISKTILFNFVNLNIQKCFYPGGGNGKKVGEEITKKVMEKCIGTGCENKKPPTVTSKTPQVQKPPQIQKSPAVSPVNASEKENKFSGITQHNAKEMAKPIKSIGENAKKSNKDYTEKNNTENVKKDNSTVNAVLQKHGVNNPIPITKQENPNIQAAIKASLGINPTDISTSSTPPPPPPPPPPLPPPPPKNIHVAESSPSSKIVTVQDELVYQKALQKQTSANVNEENLNPSQIYTGKTFSNKLYTTTITEHTQSKDLSGNQMNKELFMRELAKPDDGKTSVEVKLQDGSSGIVGGSKNGIKLTPLGQAYTEFLPKKPAPLDDGTAVDFSKIFVPEAEPEDVFKISVPPPSSDDCYLETGQQKHLLIGFDNSTDSYYIFGYFTSKKSGYVISNKQYKAFEKEQESTESSPVDTKSQHFVEFKNPIKVKAEDIKIVKYSKEYLRSLSLDSKNYFLNVVKKQNGKIPEDFNTNGLTMEDLLQLCKEHDKVVKAKEKNPKGKVQHPLTQEQQKQNKENMDKQKFNKGSSTQDFIQQPSNKKADD